MEHVGRSKGVRPVRRSIGWSFGNKLPTAFADQQNRVGVAANGKSLTVQPEIAGSEGSWQLGHRQIKAGWQLLTKAESSMESEAWGKELNSLMARL